MLTFTHVTKGYGAKKALNDVTYTFEKGKIYALVGPNGTGKSTLMKTAAGLVKPNRGTVAYNGMEIGAKTKAKIAYMSTEPFYYEFMTIKQVKKFHMDFFDDFDPQAFDRNLAFMQLTPELKVKSLSSGMAAKLKIAVTVSRRAEVIMLDEPLNGIDLIGRDQIVNAIRQMIDPRSCVIVSSHLFDELENVVTDVVFMNEGKIILAGNLRQVESDRGMRMTDIYRATYGGMLYENGQLPFGGQFGAAGYPAAPYIPGGQPVNNQYGYPNGGQPANNQYGYPNGGQPVNNQYGYPGGQPVNNQYGYPNGNQPVNNQYGYPNGNQPVNNQYGYPNGNQPVNNEEGGNDNA
ncbi:MAG: ATP-binding cassette domain-containing protein [Lachnospiraceae bacterium]|nr:ATP-binding cassette domain-containing protein [Lachnospiraceae bacterium]